MTEAGRSSDTLLMGTISLDRYLASGDVLPGGGVLNMAWNWQALGRPFQLLTRVGSEDGDPITGFLRRHGIATVSPAEVVARGRSSAIDIEILPDRQPHMDNFVGGVWDDYRLTAHERFTLRAAQRLHSVLVEGAIAELERLGDSGALHGIEVSADFLGFRHYTIDRLAETMRFVDLGFIGWPGDEDDPTVDGARRVAADLGRLLVVTMGARAVHVFDGRSGATAAERRYPVDGVPVQGTTLGCGDAFIAWFLDAWWRTRDLDGAVAQGMIGGARTTAWPRPLPDDAYAGPPAREGAPDAADPPACRARRLRADGHPPGRPDPGDEDRGTLRRWLENTRQVNANRGLVGYTGTVDGVPVSVQVTMMGSPTTGIVVEELLMLGVQTLIRVGTTGAFGAAEIGDVIVAMSSAGHTGHASAIGGGEPTAPTADLDVVLALRDAALAAGLTTHVGPIVTGDTFYDPTPVYRWGRRGYLSVEMETATLFLLAMRERAKGKQVRAGSILTVSDVLFDPDDAINAARSGGKAFYRPPEDEVNRRVDLTIGAALAAAAALGKG